MQNKVPPSSHRVEAAVQSAMPLARAIPAEENKMPPQFGNNFYCLFVARKIRDTRPEAGIVTIYLDRAEALGEPWQKFLFENAELLGEIDKALVEVAIYEDLLGLLRAFYSARDFDAGDAFDARIDPDMGITAIGIPIWKRLNVLLEKAAEAMLRVGIDPVRFYS